MLLLNRWQTLSSLVARKRDEQIRGGGAAHRGGRRPRASTLQTVEDVEYWRNSVVRELSLRIVEIGNADLENAKLSELNEELNSLVREKLAFETRLVELGGRDLRKTSNEFLAKHCVVTLDGKRYYGRARELVSYTQILNAQNSVHVRPARHILANRINGTYYGVNDHIIYPELVTLEAAKEEEIRQARSIVRATGPEETMDARGIADRPTENGAVQSDFASHLEANS